PPSQAVWKVAAASSSVMACPRLPICDVPSPSSVIPSPVRSFLVRIEPPRQSRLRPRLPHTCSLPGRAPMRALVASGSGRYADPWHPFPKTSPLLAEILSGSGFEVDVDDDVDASMGRLEGVDLLVVNAADPW